MNGDNYTSNFDFKPRRLNTAWSGWAPVFTVCLFKRGSGDPMALQVRILRRAEKKDGENVGEASIRMMNLETTGSEGALQGPERRGTEGKCLWGAEQIVFWAQPCAGDL
ncbi:hypothetical protein FB451DRAFT_1171362 [Mycena latifolia]|nr:hypothetical protein FB451DRAFT_1171362 [Mycena latifolia]